MKEKDYTLIVDESTEYFNIQEFYSDNQNGLSKKYKTNKGVVVEEGAGEEGSWFVSYMTHPNSFFSVYKEYNSKGIIKSKWATFRNRGGAVGNKYEFDNNGKLCRKENAEEDFQFTPYKVISYCLENGIDLFAGNLNYIDRYVNEHQKEFFYIINYVGMYKEKSGRITIVLNGRNGEKQQILVQRPGHDYEVLFDKNPKIIPER